MDSRNHHDYINAIDVADEHMDMILVDGRHRMECLKKAVGRVKKGGYLIFDDYQRPRYHEAHTILSGWKESSFRRYGFIKTAIFQKV